MDQEVGSRDDRDPQSRLDEVGDSHQSEGGHAEESDHSGHDHRHNSHVEADSYHGIRHDEGCIRGVGHDAHNRQRMVYE